MPHTFFASAIDLSHYGEKREGKSYLHPADIDHATVRDLERFIKISQTHPEAVIAPGYNRGTSGDG